MGTRFNIIYGIYWIKMASHCLPSCSTTVEKMLKLLCESIEDLIEVGQSSMKSVKISGMQVTCTIFAVELMRPHWAFCHEISLLDLSLSAAAASVHDGRKAAGGFSCYAQHYTTREWHAVLIKFHYRIHRVFSFQQFTFFFSISASHWHSRIAWARHRVDTKKK